MSEQRTRPRIAPAAVPALLDALYRTLEGVAARGALCPTNVVLGETLGVSDTSAGWLMRRLEGDGRIAVAARGAMAGRRKHHYRVVTLRASGACTAPRPASQPGHGVRAPATPADSDDRLERAKTFLRQRGPVVFAARVTMGGAGGDYVVVGRDLLTPAQVIERAAALGFGGA